MTIYAESEIFKKQLQAFGREVEVKYADLLRATMLALLARVAFATPVNTGRAAGSWSISRGDVGSFVVPEGEGSSPEAAVARAKLISFKSPYATWYLYNNVPYIEFLEYGHSEQAPNGMLRLGVQDFQSGIDEFLENVA